MTKQKLAIIGTGISGMGAAHLLNKKYDLTLFEKNNYVGGHTNTVYVEEDKKQIPIDTGFIVFNKVTYPNLIKLFNELNVPYTKTDMSFSVQHIAAKLEYNGSGFKGIFSQRKNLINPSFLRMVWQINRFNKECVSDMESGKYDHYTLAQYFLKKNYSNDFILKYLIPMSSAIWSSEMDDSLQFPFVSLVRFFRNHGMLGLNSQHQWYTVVNGSETYKQILIKPFKDKIQTNKNVVKIIRTSKGVDIVTNDNKKQSFDKVVIATHADEALEMLGEPTLMETELLSSFHYQKNIATLHTDTTVMPRNKKIWSAWNYRIDGISSDVKSSTIYYMNQLQKVSDRKDYFLSINHQGTVEHKYIIREFTYYHPIFSLASMAAQKKLPQLNEKGPIYFCGSYFKYGFHEDALTSGINASKKVLEHQKQEGHV